MAEEKIFLDETFPIVKYNNTAPLAGLHLLKRRANAHIANVRVIVTDKRIMVDEKMTVLANIAAVSVGDDEREIAEHNAGRKDTPNQAQTNRGCGVILLVCAVLGGIGALAKGEPQGLVGGVFLGFIGYLLYNNQVPTQPPPPKLVPHYAVVIESAGTRDNALVSDDRMVVQKIVRAISDALLSRG